MTFLFSVTKKRPLISITEMKMCLCVVCMTSQDHFRVQSINVPGKKWPFLRFWSLDIHPAKGWHQCSVWRAWRLSDKKCPLSRRAFKGVRFCDRRRYWRSSHSLYSAPNFIAMTPLLYNILGAITISLYLAISNNIFTLFGNIKQYLYLALSNIIFLFGTIKQYINQSL